MGAQTRYLALGRIESVSVTQDRTIHDPDYNLAVSRPPLDSRDRQRRSTMVEVGLIVGWSHPFPGPIGSATLPNLGSWCG